MHVCVQYESELESCLVETVKTHCIANKQTACSLQGVVLIGTAAEHYEQITAQRNLNGMLIWSMLLTVQTKMF